MEETREYTIRLNGREVRVRQWPLRRGADFVKRLMKKLGPVLKKLAAQKKDPSLPELLAYLEDALADENIEFAQEMIKWALDLPPEEREAAVEDAGIEDLTVVLERNVLFLKSRLAALFPNRTFTMPAQPSPVSESPSS